MPRVYLDTAPSCSTCLGTGKVRLTVPQNPLRPKGGDVTVQIKKCPDCSRVDLAEEIKHQWLMDGAPFADDFGT